MRRFDILHVPAEIERALIDHARRELPLECCGLLAGNIEHRGGVVRKQFPLINAAASPVEFLADGASLFAAHRVMRSDSFEMLAIYHSHPTSPARPSRTDQERSYYGESVVNLIISLACETAEIAAWWITEATVENAEMLRV